MKIQVEIDVETLPEDRLLAFHSAIGTIYVADREFELTRNITSTRFGLHTKVDGLTVTHTVDLNPVIQAAVEAIVKETTP